MSSPDTDLDNDQDAEVDEAAEQDREDEVVEQPQEEEKPKLVLDVKVDSPSACQRHVTVTIPREDINRYYDDAFNELMPKANVPGFRPGRAPRKLVESRFREDVTDQIKGNLLLDTITQVSEEHEFSAISEPDFEFDAVDVPKEGPMTFEFDLEVRPEFEMPQWKGLTVEKPVRKFTDEDVESRLHEVLRQYAFLAPQDGPARPDDHVVVDVQCRHDGKVVSEANEQTLHIRPALSFQDGTLAGFDKLMSGAKAGDVKTAKVEVSEDSPNEDLRGKEVDLSLNVLEVKKTALPELDDEFLKRIGNYECKGDLLDAVKHDLERQLTYHQQQRIRQQITSLLTQSADWDLPPDLLRRQAQRELDRAVMELRRSGFSEEEIRTHSNLLRQNSKASTATALKEHFILERLAEQEELDVEPQDYDSEIALIAAQANESPRSVRARLEKQGLMDSLRNQIIERKAVDLITSHAKFKEVEFEPRQHETTAVDLTLGGRREADIPEAKPGGEAQELRAPADRS